nr:uncharacterized protein LOC112940338 [Solanum lycopersicum]
MDKLREEIVKMSNSEPNASLSESHNSILRQHLDIIMSGLQTTPDHPPYAWMIEQALQELDEEEGSDEDSISEFIIKNNDSLPRAHKIMLKHLLEKMCERGEIVMIDEGWFFLPGESKHLNSKSKGKSKRREKEDLEQPKKQGRGKLAKKKEGGAKKGDGTTSAFSTKETDDQHERDLKVQEDGVDPSDVLLKDLRLSRSRKTIKD